MKPSAFASTFLVCFAALFCTEARAAGDPDPLFASHEILTVRITAPFKQIMKDRPIDNTNEVDGTFVLIDADGAEIDFPVKILTRGNNRRNPDVCPFAPLRVDFAKKKNKDTLFAKQNKLKLVTHCDNRSEVYRQAVIREYLAYRVFNAVTDLSFRVRLLRITYVYSDDDNKEEETYGFFIEHKNRLGKRVGMEDSKLNAMSIAVLDQEHTNLASVFEYFIGNGDFSPVIGASGETCCHNYTIFTADNKKYWPIPYDFDLTGFVESKHFRPSPDDRRRNLRQRIYKGHCYNNDFIPGSLQVFREHKSEIEAVIAAQEELDKSRRKRVDSFIASFYKELDKEEKLIKKFKRDCIG